jgi:RsiW-degrading membrane proteinase PrsW (M82 family)
MSERQNYGVLRVIHVPAPNQNAHSKKMKHPNHPGSRLFEERQVYVLTGRETTIGRALNNDLIVMDPTVSREHARLVLNADGWCLHNTAEQNILHVNGDIIQAGAHACIQSQDFFILGHTMLQLIVPKSSGETPLPTMPADLLLEQFPVTPRLLDKSQHVSSQGRGEKGKDEPQTLREKYKRRVIVPVSKECSTASDTAHGLNAHPWFEDVHLFRTGDDLEFAFLQRLKLHVGWMVGSIALTLLVLGAIVIIILNNLLGIVSLVQENPVTLLSVISIPIVTALGINLLVNFIDRYEREPWFLRLAAFLWGAVIAIPPITFIEGYVDTWRSAILGPQAGKVLDALFSALNPGVTEETVKGLGLLLLFMVLRDEFDNVTDGIVYGALIGAGFAMVENIVYFAGNPNDILFLLIGRIGLGWLNHSTFTVCFGMALGYIRHTRLRWQQIVIPLLGYLASVGLHTTFDFIYSLSSALFLAAPDNGNMRTFFLVANIGDYILPFIAQMIIVYCLIKALAHEAAIIREFLTSEVSDGIVTVEEYALLPHSFLRTRIERQVLKRNGIKQWLRVKALYQTEIGLAFRKWHVHMGDKPKLGYLQPEDAYRKRIQQLRQVILLTEEDPQS